MPSRKSPRIRVQLGDHAEGRWFERVKRPHGELAKLIAVLLSDHIGVGLAVHHGRAMLPLNAKDLDLPQDLTACIDLPDWRGVWQVVTFKTND